MFIYSETGSMLNEDYVVLLTTYESCGEFKVAAELSDHRVIPIETFKTERKAVTYLNDLQTRLNGGVIC